jgi:outer membrane protein OmpA-like peptidoglycan-associated protein
VSRTRSTIRPNRQIQEQVEQQRSGARMRLLEQLNAFAGTRDTPRGLVVTMADTNFNGSQLKGTSTEQVARIGRVLSAQPGLRVQVEGYTDSGNSEALSARRAEAVQAVLLGAGMPTNMVSTRGLGDSRPMTSNATPEGRMENRRVEIVVSGESLGSLPYWDHSYSVTQR